MMDSRNHLIKFTSQRPLGHPKANLRQLHRAMIDFDLKYVPILENGNILGVVDQCVVQCLIQDRRGVWNLFCEAGRCLKNLMVAAM